MRTPDREGEFGLAALLLLVLAPACMGTNVVFGKAIIAEAPPFALAFWRWLLAFLCLLPFVFRGVLRHRRLLLTRLPLIAVLGFLGMMVSGGGVYFGLQTTTATNAGLIYALSPLLIILFGARRLADLRHLPLWLGGTAAFVGVTIILMSGDLGQLLELRFNQGDLFILAAAISWAVYSILLRRVSSGLPTSVLFAAIAGAGALQLGPAALIEATITDSAMNWSTEVAWGLGGIVLLSSLMAFGFYQKGVHLVGPRRAGPFMYLMPFFSTLFAVALLGEILALHHLAGGGLIIGGLALANWPRRPA